MRYCHECGAEVGSKATECAECSANLIGSTTDSQGSPAGSDAGFIDRIRALFDRSGDVESAAATPTADGGTDDADDAGDGGVVAAIRKRFD